jgi:protein involved in polysaccharide export with SLBB domain
MNADYLYNNHAYQDQMNKKSIQRARRLLYTGLVLLSGILIAGACAQKKSAIPAVEGAPITESRPISFGKYRAVVLADVDNDGNIDVVAGGSPPNSLTVSYGDGQGRVPTLLFLPVKGDVQSVAVADVDNDGLKDIVFSIQREASGVMVWLNQQKRHWKQGMGPISTNQYQGVEATDINGDGNVDIIAANATSEVAGGIQIWLGDGRGSWPVQTGPTNTGIYMDVVTADFNRDGHLDLAAAGWGGDGQLAVWFGDGHGNWSSAPTPESGSLYGVNVADLNGDGYLDLMAATYRAGIGVYLGDGRGQFTPIDKPKTSASFWDVTATDLDHDGEMDLLATSNDGFGVGAWRFVEGKRWQAIKGRYPLTGTYYEITAGDLNRDGYNDVCAASYGEGIKFWHGRMASDFTDLTDYDTSLKVGRLEERLSDTGENDVYTTIDGIPGYKVGPGDILEITIWQAAKPTREEVLIRPDGRISFGFVDNLYVKGFTPNQLDAKLTKRYKEYVRNPRIDVIVKEYESKFVSLTGAIGAGIRTSDASTGAGLYPLNGKVSLLEMISRAGGPSKDANLREVRVRRRSGEAFVLNLYLAIYQGDPDQNLILDDGDLIYIPTLVLDANRVFVFGEVARPGVIKLAESNMRLADAIAQAGGPTVFAIKQETRIVRGDITQPEILLANVKKLFEQGDQTQNLALNNGDFIYVPKSFFGDANEFWQRIRPIFDIIVAPAYTVNQWNEAIDRFQVNP